VTRGLTGRLLAVSGIVLLLCAAIFAVVLSLVSDLRGSTTGVRVSRNRIEDANRVLALVVDLETGVRGFVISHNPRFLEPYNHGMQELPRATADLRRSAAGDPRQAAAAARITAKVADYERLQAAQVARAHSDPKAAAAIVSSGQGKRRVDAMRSDVSAIVSQERRVEASQRADVDDATKRAVTLTIGALLGVPLLLLALAVAGAHGVVAPLRRLAATARRLQEGDLDARVPEGGAGEVGVLSEAFNAMAESLRHNREELENHNAELEAQGEELETAVEELEREKNRIETFHTVVAALAAESELERLAPLVLGLLRTAGKADVGALYLADPIEPQRGLALHEVSGLDRERLPEILTPAAGLPARAITDRRPVEASHGSGGLRVRALGEDVVVRHELHLPLVHAERVIGVVTLATVAGDGFRDVDMLWRMADAAAVALANALSLETDRHRAAVNRAVLETAHDAFIAVNEDLHITVWTPQATALFGYTEPEALGERVDELLIPKRWRPGYRSEHERLLAKSHSGPVTRRFEIPALHQDGHRLRVEISVSPLRLGDTWQVNAFVRDIGERVAREHAREAQRAVSQALAETPADEEVVPRVLEALGRGLHWPVAIHWVPDPLVQGMRCGAVWRDPAFDGAALQDAACSAPVTDADSLPLRACRSEEPVWGPLNGHGPDPGPMADAARAAGLGGAIALPITCGPGGLGVLELWQRRTTAPEPALIEALQAVSAIVAEVLERRRAEAEAQRLKDEFFALVSHELRTPLTSIIGYLELLTDEEAGEVPPDQRRFLGVIERNARRLLRLVGDLLFVAQVEAGTLSLERREVDLDTVVREAVEAGRPRAEQAGVGLTASTDDVPPLEGDPERLAQVVDNLISNAVKFTPPGGEVTVRAGRRNGRALIEVQDTGMGIPAAEQERLFERFYRTESATERSIPGIGLGLSICRAIAEGHGGVIGVQSEEGEGTTFTVELPIVPPNGSRRPATEEVERR
jgi:PAS domain S-box-containing protein